MKIVDLTCDVYRWPRPTQISNGSNTYSDGVLLLLTVWTDANIAGFGWIGGTAAERPLEMFVGYAAYYRDRVLGLDPLDSEALVAGLEDGHIKTFGFGGAHCQVTGALNCALWDLRGRHEQQPVHRLLSGSDQKRRVRGYIAGGYYYGEDEGGKGIEILRQELRHNVDELRAKSVKIKVGNPAVGLEIDEKRVAAAREEIGSDVELMVDANCAFKDVETAVAYARAFAPYDLFWLEEPFRPDDFEAHRRLASETEIPIATGENISSVPHFQEMISQGALKVVNADVAILTGGYDAGMTVGRLAKAHGCIVAPHGCQELQCHYVAAADEAEGRLEIYPPKLDPERDLIFSHPLMMDADGFVNIPDLPGIGLTPDLEALAPHRVPTSKA